MLEQYFSLTYTADMMLDPDRCCTLFSQMLRIRLFEETLSDEYSKQDIRCPMHLSIGQEGVAVGVCHALRMTDQMMSTHRAHAHYLAKGGDMGKMVAEMYGKETGCCGGIGGSMHLIDLSVGMLGCTPIVGGTFPLAVGVALANQMQRNDIVTTIFFGEGMTEEGVFAEALNFAALKRLPILFICENNGYSVYSPLSVRQPQERNLITIARGHGVDGKQGRGNDVEEVHQLATEAVEAIKMGKGPQLLEFDTYRWREHCGPNYDNHIGYRSEDEFLHWQQKCPINFYRHTLYQRNLLDDERYKEMESMIRHEISEAFAQAKAAKFAHPKTIHPLYAL